MLHPQAVKDQTSLQLIASKANGSRLNKTSTLPQFSGVLSKVLASLGVIYRCR